MLLEKFFKLKKNNTDVKTEVLAGITTFVSMVYIISLNPNILSAFEINTPLWNGIFLATCISAFLGTMLVGLLANKPLAMAPGMGSNSYFAIVTASTAAMLGISYTEAYQAGLVIILLEGILFVILTIIRVREKIIDAIPECIRISIAPAIGIFLMFIALKSNVTIFSDSGGPFYMGDDFFGAINTVVAREKLGSAFPEMYLSVITMLAGFFTIAVLAYRRIPGCIPLGILAASIIYWSGAYLCGRDPFASLQNASWLPLFNDFFSTTFFRFDFDCFMKIGLDTALLLIVTFCVVDLFDTVGTLIGTSSKTNLLNEKLQMKKALLSDAVATVVGGTLGTSTVTTFAESNAGIAAGGRTGLTSAVIAILFLFCMFLAPAVALIPAPATSAALLYVGILMFRDIKRINFDDLTEFAPAMIMIVLMPASHSIGHAIGLGLISYAVIKLFCGKSREVSLLTYTVSILFLIKFFLLF